MRRLIVTADDFGASPAVNEAVERGHRDGILTAASLMVAGEAAADAVTRARAMPSLGVGLHLVLVEGRPMLPPERVPALVDASGRFRTDMARMGADIFFRPAARRQLRAEVEAQFAAFAATGLPLDHVNAHKHYHLHPTIAATILAVGARHGLAAARAPVEPIALLRRIEPTPRPLVDRIAAPWARGVARRFRRAGVTVPDRVFGLAWSGAMTAARVEAILATLPAGLSELYLHPATEDHYPGSAPGYRYRDELSALLDPAVRRAVATRGIMLRPVRGFRMTRASLSIAAATLLGLAIGLWAIGVVGFHDLVRAAAHMGVAGFLLFASTTLVVLATLGAALIASMRDPPWHRLALFTWSRATREGANDLLPFSQLGGLVVGARTLIAGGIAPTRIYAAITIDLATEMMAQVVLTLFGLGMVATLLVAPGGIAGLAWAGAAGMLLLTAAFVLLQRPVLRFCGMLAGRVLPSAQIAIEAVLAELAAFSARRGAILPPLLFNMAAWLLSIGAGWLGIRLLGGDLSFARTAALEALIFALRSSAFFIPGALGVQEAGYILLGPLLGLDRDTAMALSLAKRARDVSIALPTLLIWQATDLWQSPPRPPPGRMTTRRAAS